MLARIGVFLTAASLIAVVSLSGAQESDSTQPNKTISVDAFQPERVIGHLREPLGSIVRVTGVSVDGDETRRKADSGQTLLKIETVNGKRLEEPVYFTFRRAAEGIEKPEAGIPFDYFVHEWGSFDGVIDPPKELGIDAPIVAHDGFYYRPEITIHKSNSIERRPKGQRK